VVNRGCRLFTRQFKESTMGNKDIRKEKKKPKQTKEKPKTTPSGKVVGPTFPK
jgi:hypothetical protein